MGWRRVLVSDGVAAVVAVVVVAAAAFAARWCRRC